MAPPNALRANPEKAVPRPAAGVTGASVIPLTDFDQAGPIFSNWEGRFDQISRGRFGGQLQVVRGGMIRLVEVESNQRVLLRGRDRSGMMSFYPVTPGNAGSVWQGRQLTPGQLVVHGTDVETIHCCARQTRHLGLSLAPSALEEATRLLMNMDQQATQRDWSVLNPPASGFAPLYKAMTQMLSVGVADPSWLSTAEGHEHEQECVRLLVAALGSNSAPQLPLSLQARTRLLRRAEDLMRARLAGSFGAIDLCRELGVNDRTLRLAFRERFGLGPMTYFRYLRLNAVRSRLKTEAVITIAEAALEYGFHHLGNFAADYRRLFGELPSATPRHSV